MKDTNFLKFIAIVLIFNSHCEAFYPISALATGGMFGNALFFMLSSYGLLISEKKSPRTFLDWYTRRIQRIYPPVWVLLFVLIFPLKAAGGQLSLSRILDVGGLFFYPPFWFLKALMIFYFIVFFLIKNYHPKKFTAAFILGTALYTMAYITVIDLSVFSIESMPFKLLFYFLIMLFGIRLACLHESISYQGWKDFVMLFLSIGIIYTHKSLMNYGLLTHWQFIEHIMVFPGLFYALKTARSPFVTEKIMQSPRITPAINFVSEHTLEIYIIHVTIKPLISQTALPFPLNWLLFVALTLALSAVTHRLSKKLTAQLAAL